LLPGALDFDPATFAYNSDVPPEAGPDPFDPASLRLSADLSGSLGVKRALFTIPVRKPAREWWIRVHPDVEYRLQTMVVELKEDREVYLVHQSLWPGLAMESTFSPRMLFVAVNRQGTVFVWPVKLPDAGGMSNPWIQSALQAAELAMARWVRVQPDMHLGAYQVLYSEALQQEPDWPDLTLQQVLRLAFKDHFIDSADHPVLKRLRGES
jgi:hypothetical protein